MIKGVDISNWQGLVNYDALRGAASFVIMKATEGNYYIDKYLVRNKAEARRVGLLVGYYHFANGAATAEEQADYFVKALGDLEKGEILVLDYETHYSDPVDFCKRFLDRVHSQTGVKPLVYLNQSLANGHDWEPVIAGDYGLWLAQYDNNSSGVNANPWPVTAMKQYTSSGSIPGIGGKVDLDSFFGDEATFKKYGY